MRQRIWAGLWFVLASYNTWAALCQSDPTWMAVSLLAAVIAMAMTAAILELWQAGAKA